ncbi:PREDICTED: V-type proton ATPase subunit S1-like, partial [Merops nubicus]|uniref:V-type proton ATPase subunit S1-like n=1 Tax=Merops nubicus TaxID=57421 RepID=UPI0004F05446
CQDLQYMTEAIWGCQSAISACSDLYDLVMVRWDKQHEWSPWNTILLTKEEADAHLKLRNLQMAARIRRAASEAGSAAVHTPGLPFAAGQARTRSPGVTMQLSAAAPAPLLCTLTLLFRLALSVHHVPVLLWSTLRSQWNPDSALHEGHIVSKQELTELLQPVFTQNSRNLILFLQDMLSIDDFTYFSESSGNKNPFQNVQESLRSSPSSLVLPAVDCEATRHLLSFLQESKDWKLTHVTNLNISQLEVNTSKPNLLVVQLQPLVSGLNEISTLEAIAENDKIIGRLTMDLQERGIHFSVIYTAVRPSR